GTRRLRRLVGQLRARTRWRGRTAEPSGGGVAADSHERRSREAQERSDSSEPRGARRPYSGFSSRNPSGGSVRASEYGKPCDAPSSASRRPALPTLLPP